MSKHLSFCNFCMLCIPCNSNKSNEINRDIHLANTLFSYDMIFVVNRFNHTSGVTALTPTDRPKSVRNRYVIKVFGGVVYVVTLLFGFFCGCRDFCHRTESDLFIFLLLVHVSIDDLFIY